MARVTTWRSALWIRWRGWTAVLTVVLSVWGVSQFPQSPLRIPVGEVVFWGVTLGLAALPFAIGVRLADWWWVFGVFVANVLQFCIVIRVLEWPPEAGQAGLLIIFLFVLYLLVMLPAAAAGVWWGKRRDRRHHY